jgi:hypothetical protein
LEKKSIRGRVSSAALVKEDDLRDAQCVLWVQVDMGVRTDLVLGGIKKLTILGVASAAGSACARCRSLITDGLARDEDRSPCRKTTGARANRARSVYALHRGMTNVPGVPFGLPESS